MNPVKVYTSETITKLTRKREFETKIGEKVTCSSGTDWLSDLASSSSRFVILGIPEDIGVRANHGRAGASSAFKPAIDSFLNQQHNIYLNGSEVFIMGEIMVDDLMTRAEKLDHHNASDLGELRKLTSLIDERVSDVIKEIVKLRKTPIVIGGGHNNAFGNIHGCYEAIGEKLNVLNFDSHLDFRPLEGRHSGNAFSYAFEKGFVDRYAVMGMHEQYNNTAALQQFSDNSTKLFYHTYESIFVREQIDYRTAIKQCVAFVKDRPCGIEIDLDAIITVPSSAKTSSGFSPLQARQFVHACAASLEPLYLHIAEGAPVLSHIKADNKTGKLIAYLITDFIKALS